MRPLHRAVCGLALGAGLQGLTTLTASTAAAAGDETRRVALIVGANDGGASRPRLRYATEDAKAMGRLLGELGGVAGPDRVLLIDPDPASLRSAIGALGKRLSTTGGARTEVVFYYSGHSDERGLLLGEQRLDYAELRAALHALPGDVRIAILDSCASGALVSAKGGQHVSGFLPDEANKVEGHAFLTSSSASEVSQEAESLGGSFFTHALLTGLRGGADVNSDGLVTLNEAYRFAYDETLSRTETTRFGPQHANFDIQLSGSGDLVMTDLRARTAPLLFAPALSGRLALRDDAGRLVAELDKRAGAPTTLWVEPGSYSLTWQGPSGPARAAVKIDGANTTTVSPGSFSALPMIATMPRGDAPLRNPAGEAIMGALQRVSEEALKPDTDVMLNVVVRGEALKGVAIGLATTALTGAVEGAQISIGGNTAGGAVQGSQVSVGLNDAIGPLRGAQLSVGANTAAAVAGGAQVSVGLNHAAGPTRGSQLSVGGNITNGSVNGAQLATGFNLAQGSVRGLQLAQGVNVANGPVSGAQISAGFNWTPSAQGAQITAGVNRTSDGSGAQIAAGLNTAAEFHGAQIGSINVVDNIQGSQLGLVNVAHRVAGPQIGLVNVADHVDGPTIGLINLVRDGIHDLEIGGERGGRLDLTVKLGGQRVYSTLQGSYASAPTTGWTPWGAGLGLGLRPVDRLLVWDIEAGAHTYFSAGPDGLSPDGGQLLVPSADTSLALGLLDRVQPYWTTGWFLSVPTDGARSPSWIGGEPWEGAPTLRSGLQHELGLRVALGPSPASRRAPAR